MSNYDSALSSAQLASQAAKRTGTASDHADAARAWAYLAYLAFLDKADDGRSPFDDTRDYEFFVEDTGFTGGGIFKANDASKAARLFVAQLGFAPGEIEVSVVTVPSNGIRSTMTVRVGTDGISEVVK